MAKTAPLRVARFPRADKEIKDQIMRPAYDHADIRAKQRPHAVNGAKAASFRAVAHSGHDHAAHINRA